MNLVSSSLCKWGSIPFKRSLAKCEIKFSDRGFIEASDLKLLLSKKIDVLVVEGFLKHQALSHTQQVLAGYHKGDLKLYPESTRYGFACEETYQHETLKYYYDKSSTLTVAKHREEMFPYMSWMDKLRVELDEAHPAGACLDHDEGKKKGPFIQRGYFHDMKAQIEARALPPHMLQKNLKAHLVALQFLVAPPKGGHLEFYKGALTEEEAQGAYLKNLCVLPESLPSSDSVVKAFAGRLVMFHSDLPFKMTQVETEEIIINKEKDEKKTNEIPLVVLESFILSKHAKAPLALMR